MQFTAGIHFDSLSEHGTPAHFYGANGFPTGGYFQLLQLLKNEFALSTLYNRATWPDQSLPAQTHWQLYADDLIEYLDTQVKQPVIGIGHSLGATTTLLAAIKRPDLFKKLVLIEPAMTSPTVATLLSFIPFTLVKQFQPIKHTVNKQEHWPSEQHFYQDLRQRRVFKRISNENLNTLAVQSLVQNETGGHRLKFPKAWEAKNYATAFNVFQHFAKNKLPVVAIRGKPSAYFTQKSWRTWQKVADNTTFSENLNFGHLFPLESPEQCFSMITNGLKQV